MRLITNNNNNHFNTSSFPFFFFCLACLLFGLGFFSSLATSLSVDSTSSTSLTSEYNDDSYGYGSWVQLGYSTGAPSPRVFAASAVGSPVPPPYAPTVRNGLVVFGGTTDPVEFEPTFNDVWVFNPADDHFDGRTWTQVQITPDTQSPAPRCLSAIAVADTVLYMFGGFNGTTWFNDLWSLNLLVLHNPGTTVQWKLLPGAPDGPPVMCGMTMIWSYINSYSNSLYVFGGGVDKKHLYADVWLYDLASDQGWGQASPFGTWPSAREFHSAVINSAGTQMTIFGGYDYGYNYFDDYWVCELPEVKWTQVNNANRPGARANFAAALVMTSDQPNLVIYGGRSNIELYGDTWAHSSTGWKQFSGTPNPGYRFGSASGAYQQQNAMIVFGGMDQYKNLYNDTWLFSMQYGF
eukprot:TRINITY_DN3350_c0_g5_i1.p1 TRINITY_DN3350_c0_g5~~TRINITY_DN3350_c0_g5_i1.p1  ORF type:complete len:407 (-),score=76.99 TRINITY_DN3350_c0_g5_i1:23-1243(-)